MSAPTLASANSSAPDKSGAGGGGAGGGTAAPKARAARRSRRRRVERKPVAAIGFTVFFFVVFYLPIAVVALFSFNSRKSLTVFGGFSLRWYDEFRHSFDLLGSLSMSLRVSLVAMVGSVILGVALALGMVRARGKLGSFAGFIMLIPLVTPEIVTGVASQMLFTGMGIALSQGTVMIAEVTFSISYVTVILRSRVAAMNPELEEAAMDLGATRWQALRLVTLPALLPAVLASAVLVFALVFDDFVLANFTTGVHPQPLPVTIYSQIRNGVRPTINAVGTVMLVGSIGLIALAMVIPRFFGRRGGLDILSGE